MLIRLLQKDIQRAIRFTSRTFVASEPTSVALKFTTCDFTTAFQDVMKKCVDSGHSFAFSKGGEIVAQSLSVSYDEFTKANYGYTRETQPMFDLFEKLEVYKPLKKCLVVFAISSEIEGKGISSLLLSKTIESAKADGFKVIIGDCTNYKSQNLFKKYGFETVVDIKYEDFEYGVNKPFERIEHTKSLKRMVLYL